MTTSVPSSFYDHTSGIAHFGINAVAAGIPRSATTMVYQILRDVYQHGVIKTHGFIDVHERIPVVLTVRDPRDALVSWYRIKYAEEVQRNADQVAKDIGRIGTWVLLAHNIGPPTPIPMTFEDIVRIVGEYYRWAWYAHCYTTYKKNVLILRYEHFVQNPLVIRNALERHLGREVAPAIIQSHDLRHNWGLNRMQDIVDPIWNPDTATGPKPDGHCHDGRTGIWKAWCPEHLQDTMIRLLSSTSALLGYDVPIQDGPGSPFPK